MSEILTKKEEILKRLLDQGHISFTEMLLFLKDEFRNEINKEQVNPFRGLIAPNTTQLGLTNPLNPYYGSVDNTYTGGNGTVTTYTGPIAAYSSPVTGAALYDYSPGNSVKASFEEEIDKIK